MHRWGLLYLGRPLTGAHDPCQKMPNGTRGTDYHRSHGSWAVQQGIEEHPGDRQPTAV